MMGENTETPQSAESPDSGSDAERPKNPQPDEVSAEISKDARNMAMLCHLLAIFTGFIAPLIIWLLKKSEEPYVDQQGKEALNFQITIILAMFAAVLLSFICIGVPLLFAIPIVNLIFCIIASIKASNGVAYRYPVSLRLIK